MPWAAIAAIASLAGTGVSVGETLANQPNPTVPVTPPAQTGPTAQDLAQQKALVARQLPNTVAQTSGTTGGAYDANSILQTLGILGQPGAQSSANAAVGQQFTPANNAPTNATVANQPVSLADFLNNFSGAQ